MGSTLQGYLPRSNCLNLTPLVLTSVFQQERYCYPKKDDQGNVEMTPTHKKKAKRFYRVEKECILPRHPYVWRGLVTVSTNVQGRLKDSHKDLLYAMLKVRLEEDNAQGKLS